MQRRARWWGVVLVAMAVLCGCKPDSGGQLPDVSGERIAAKKAPVKGFGLVAAYPDQQGDTLALALEFSRPLVGTQEF
ncbi:MAG TPA: hypothetical protein VM847_00455, partial [Tahibacter sp.]|nr:hypothetical protein [Tahibacter sp.]